MVRAARERIDGAASSSSAEGFSPTLTAITVAAPRRRTTSAGTLFRTPPSTSIHGPISTGPNTAGIDIVARSACENDPSPSTTTVDVRRSTATLRNGVGSWSNDSRSQ